MGLGKKKNAGVSGIAEKEQPGVNATTVLSGRSKTVIAFMQLFLGGKSFGSELVGRSTSMGFQ